MIIPIRNQPITFSPKETETGVCGSNATFCQLVRLNDKICFQLRQKSCLPQLLCNSDFSIFGTDLVSPHGDFDVPADIDNIYESNWSFDEDTWYYDSYGQRMCTLEGHIGADARFDIGGYGMDADCTYVFSFEISGYVAPDVDTGDGDLTVTLPDGTTQLVTGNGSYSFTTGTGTFFLFTPGATWEGCIDNVSLTCAGTCWDVSPVNNVIFGGDGICKTGITATTVTEQAASLSASKYYQLIVEVRGSTLGSIEFFLGTTSIGTTDENGIFTLSGISDGTQFSFVMSADFDGCVRQVWLYELSQNYTLLLKNATTDATILDLTASLIFTHDRIDACVNFDETMLGYMIGNFISNEVCMYLELSSPADGEVVTNGAFTLTNSSSILDDWGFSGTLGYEAIQGQVILKSGTGYFLQDMSGAGFVQGNTYYVAFDIICLDHGETDPEFDSFTLSIGSDGAGAGGVQVWTSANFPSQPGHYVFKVTSGTDGDYLAFHFTDADGLEKVCIDNVSVRTTPCKHESLTSNCIKYRNEIDGVPGWDGSMLITACNEEGESMGFDWSEGFKLQARLFMHLVAPRYASREDETYLFSDGTRKRVYADTSKVMDLLFDAVDELTHDYIRTMLKCDILYIEDGYALENRYICLDKEYSPEWDKKGLSSLAEARTEVQKYDNTIFNTNCK